MYGRGEKTAWKKQVEIAYSSQEANVGEQTGGTEDAGTGKDD